MGTSLAEQLQRLAVPQTAPLLQKDKKRVSLLFDAKEAAGLKRETVYQIGLDGLEELILKNPMFEQFRNNLFHITSKSFERSVQTAEENAKLNTVIRRFILRLSPYFMLSASHKALEWLINRFHIHQYNRDDLLMLVLPYHESNIFVRVVQLMKFKDHNDRFYFLKSLQKTGVHLSKQGLLTRAANDVHFVEFVANFVTLLIREHDKPSSLTTAFNFYCTVLTSAIEFGSPDQNSKQVVSLLPVLLKGLKSDIPDFCAASYVIVAKLVAKVKLDEQLLTSLVANVAKAKVETLRTEAVLVLLVVYQTQGHFTDFPVKNGRVRQNLSQDWFGRIVNDLWSSGCHVAPLLGALMSSALAYGVKEDCEEGRGLVEKLMGGIKFDDDFVATVLGSLLSVVKLRKQPQEHLQAFLTTLLKTIERQYPEPFDKQVYKILSSTGKDPRRRKLQKILKDTMLARFEIFDKLHHPNSEVRNEAVKFLSDNHETLRESEREMIKSSLIDRLNDDDVTVVRDTLELVGTIEFLEREPELTVAYRKLAGRCLRDEWPADVGDAILEVLCGQDGGDWGTFATIFPFLLLADVDRARDILRLDYFRNCHFMTVPDHFEGNGEQFLDCLTKSEDHVTQFLGYLGQVGEFDDYFNMLVLTSIVPWDSPVELVAPVVEVLTKSRPRFDHEFTGDPGLFQYQHFHSLKSGRFPLEALLNCLRSLIDRTRIPGDPRELAWRDFSTCGSLNKFFAILTRSLFVDGKGHHASFLLERFFGDDRASQLDFLLNISLTTGDTLWRCVAFVPEDWASTSDLTVPLLVASLLSPNKSDRIKVLELVKQLSRSSDLLKRILRQREEIAMDEEQVPLVLFNVLTTDKRLASQLVDIACQTSSPDYLKSRMLRLLSHVNSFEICERVADLGLKVLETSGQFKTEILQRCVDRVDSQIAGLMGGNSRTWHFVRAMLRSGTAALLVLNQIDKDFYSSLKDEDLASELLDLVVEIATTSNDNHEILPSCSRFFKHIDLDARLILPQFLKMREVHSPKLDPLKLKRRINIVPTIDILDTPEWKRGVTVLEFIQDKKKIRNLSSLVPILFEVLKRCLDFDEQSTVEYPKQLILSSILQCCPKLEADHRLESVFNIELVVQCIRASQNPQTHHHALLLLAQCAHLVPNQVLHNVMSIFTFIGSSVLRHDDAYSFEIISRIVDSIVPILIRDPGTTAISVLRVFVDVLVDVPEHRRLALYKQLLTKLGPGGNLSVFLLLVFESHINNSVKNQDKRRLEIAADVCREFEPDLVLRTTIDLVGFLAGLPDEEIGEEVSLVADIRFKSQKQFRFFKYTVVTFVGNLLSSREYVTRIAALSGDNTLNLEPLYKDLVVGILLYIQRISKVSDRHSQSPQAQYWKIMLHHSYDILDSINALLTPQMFLLVIKGLMVHKTLSTVKRRALELLNSKLQHETFGDDIKKELYSLMPALISIIETIESEDADELIVQTALLSLKLLVKLLAATYPDKFSEVLDFVTNLIKVVLNKSDDHDNVLASMVLCLAELCANLRAHAISSLPVFMPALLQVLKRRPQDSGTGANLLLLSCVTALNKVVNTLPLFMSPHLQKILYELSILTGRFDQDQEQNKALGTKLKNTRSIIGGSIPARVLVPAVGGTYERLLKKGHFEGIGPLMEILCENLDTLKGAEISQNLPELTTFFLSALQFRVVADKCDKVTEVEAFVIKALTSLVLKLSESSFRPLYYKLFDWAVRSDEKDRLITFYALSKGIAESLKGLFVLFVGHFLNNSAQVLDACNTLKCQDLYFPEDHKNRLLLENILETLRLVFTYDNQKFINKDRFEVLMRPLVDQLENTLGGVDSLVARSDRVVTPCIVQFAVATADDSLWKQMNYQILLKMRHSDSAVRLIGLRCLAEVVRKLGEDFLPLLPETIPFLAELLEDEDEDVEKECRRAVQEMEKVLGEPLQKYF